MEGLFGFIGRRWPWLIVGAIVGALVGGGSASLRTDAWVADSLVVLTDARIPPEEFSAVATAIFPTDPVLGSVVSELGIDQTPGSLISSGAVRVQPAPGGLAVRVVARTQDEALSIQLANAAAAALATTGEENGLGEMAQFAVQDARREKDPVVAWAIVGALIGIAIVVILLALRYLVRGRDPSDEERAGAQVTIRVHAAPAPDGQEDDEGAVVVTPEHLLEGLWNGFLATADGAASITGLRVDDGPAGWAVLGVAAHLDRLAGGDPTSSIAWTSASQPLPSDAADTIAVIAPAGASARLDDVRRIVRAGRPGAFVALVVVSAPDLSG